MVIEDEEKNKAKHNLQHKAAIFFSKKKKHKEQITFEEKNETMLLKSSGFYTAVTKYQSKIEKRYNRKKGKNAQMKNAACFTSYLLQRRT